MPILRRLRAGHLTAAYLAWVGLGSAAIGFVNMRLANGWAIGEWLTNYSAGFIRRGLEGEAVLVVARAFHLSFAHVVLALQLTVYAVFLTSVWALARRVRWSFWTVASFLSPATLSFIVMDPPNGFKKEILLFAALGVLLLVLERPRIAPWRVSALLTLVCPLLVLSHEPLMLYLPYFAAAVALPHVCEAAARRQVAQTLAVPALASFVALILAVTHPGDRSMAAAICASVGGTLGTFGKYQAGLCNGSIAWLGQSSAEAHAFVMRAVHVYGDYRIYAPRLLLALVPPLAGLLAMARRGLRREAHVVLLAWAVAGTGSMFLFYVGRDWGRWIHIHAVCLMLLTLALARRDTQATAPRRLWQTALLALYGCFWTLPAVEIYQGRFGYAGVYRYLHGYSTKHPEDPHPELRAPR